MHRLLIAAFAGVALTLSSAAFNSIGSPVDVLDRQGATVRMDTARREIYFIFTADSMFEGAPLVLDALEKRGAKASFFFTGNFLRGDTMENRREVIERIISAGHYVGPHGDRHIQLAEWDGPRTELVSPDSAVADMEATYVELDRYGVSRDVATTIVPPFEWYNASHIKAYKEDGFHPVNPTPSLLTYRDYTTPEMGEEYYPSDTLWNQLMEYEKRKGLCGAIIILHLGTQPVRTDKFYYRFPEILDTLIARGYGFRRF